MNFLFYLDSKKLLSSYASTIDWWLTDNKFQGWDRNKVTQLTRKLHALPGIDAKQCVHYGARKNLSFPKRASKYPQLHIMQDSSEGRDWIRHIRNSIAHGHVEVKSSKGTLIVEMKDFSRNGEQSAYMLIPLDFLIKIKDVYEKIKKGK